MTTHRVPDLPPTSLPTEPVMHPLFHASTFELALAVDTLMAERQLLQLHASLASHMSGAGGAVQQWFERRLEEVDVTVKELVLLAREEIDGGEDCLSDIDHIEAVTRRLLRG